MGDRQYCTSFSFWLAIRTKCPSTSAESQDHFGVTAFVFATFRYPPSRYRDMSIQTICNLSYNASSLLNMDNNKSIVVMALDNGIGESLKFTELR
jgi:hypothetical protein